MEKRIHDLVGEIIEALESNRETISAMESCTAGFVTATIASVDGSSAILKFSAVTYSNEYKIKMGVDPATINKYGVYSKEVSMEMARNIAIYAASNYGI